jgi:hypothetical protein
MEGIQPPGAWGAARRTTALPASARILSFHLQTYLRWRGTWFGLLRPRSVWLVVGLIVQFGNAVLERFSVILHDPVPELTEPQRGPNLVVGVWLVLVGTRVQRDDVAGQRRGQLRSRTPKRKTTATSRSSSGSSPSATGSVGLGAGLHVA